MMTAEPLMLMIGTEKLTNIVIFKPLALQKCTACQQSTSFDLKHRDVVAFYLDS